MIDAGFLHDKVDGYHRLDMPAWFRRLMPGRKTTGRVNTWVVANRIVVGVPEDDHGYLLFRRAEDAEKFIEAFLR